MPLGKLTNWGEKGEEWREEAEALKILFSSLTHYSAIFHFYPSLYTCPSFSLAKWTTGAFVQGSLDREMNTGAHADQPYPWSALCPCGKWKERRRERHFLCFQPLAHTTAVSDQRLSVCYHIYLAWLLWHLTVQLSPPQLSFWQWDGKIVMSSREIPYNMKMRMSGGAEIELWNSALAVSGNIVVGSGFFFKQQNIYKFYLMVIFLCIIRGFIERNENPQEAVTHGLMYYFNKDWWNVVHYYVPHFLFIWPTRYTEVVSIPCIL